MKLTEALSNVGSALNRNGTDRRAKSRRERTALHSVEQFEVRQLLSATPDPGDHVDRPGPDATMMTIDQQNSSLRLDGDIGHINDADVFRFSLPEAAVLTFDFGASESGYIPSLELLNSDGISIEYTSNGSQFIVPAGDWYLSVSGNPGFQSGDYSIDVLIDHPGHEIPPDDHVDIWGPEATLVLVDPSTSTLTLEGFMNHVNDRDFFQFELEVPTRLSFQWSVPDGAFHGSITIYDIYGQVVTDNYPWSLELSDSVSLEAGRWLIMISGNPGFHHNEYTVTAFVDDCPNATAPETEPYWPIPSTAPSPPGVIDDPTDVIDTGAPIDWFEVLHIAPPAPYFLWQSVTETTTGEAPVQSIGSLQLINDTSSNSHSAASLPSDAIPVVRPEDWSPSWIPVQKVRATMRSELWTERNNADGSGIPAGVFHDDRIPGTSIMPSEQPGPNRVWVRAIGNQSGNTSRSRWSAMSESKVASIGPELNSLTASLAMFWGTSDLRDLSSLLDDQRRQLVTTD